MIWIKDLTQIVLILNYFMGKCGKREPTNLKEAIKYGTIEDIKTFINRGVC